MLLLTGATGLIGSALLERLVATGTPVRCLVRDPRRLGTDRVRVQIALGDLADPPSFRNAMRGITTVVHLAASIRDQPRRLHRGAQRHRDLAHGRRGRARRRRALRLLLRAGRDDAPPHAAPALEGAGRGGRQGVRPAHDRLRSLDRLRAPRPVDADPRAPFAASGDADAAAGAARCTSRSGRRTSPTASCPSSVRAPTANGSARYELAGPDVLSHEAIVRLALHSFGRRRPRAARAHAGRVARSAPPGGARGVARPRHLGRGRAAGGAHDDRDGHGRRASGCGVEPQPMATVLGAG